MIGINRLLAGLTTTLGLIFVNPVTFADEVTIYVLPSYSNIHWSAPHVLALGAGFASLGATLSDKFSSATYPHPLSHANVKLSCTGTGPNDPDVDILTGMTTKDGFSEKEFITKGYGLGIFFIKSPGQLEDRATILAALDARARLKDLRVMKYSINHATCQRLAQFHREWISRGYFERYGYPSIPRRGLGAGCTQFAMAFLDLAGILDDEMLGAWTKPIQIPLHLVGGPAHPDFPNFKPVSVMKVLSGEENSSVWNYYNEPYIPYTAKDATFMANYVDSVIQRGGVTPKHTYQIINEYGVGGIHLDATSIPTPTDPIWREGAGYDVTPTPVYPPLESRRPRPPRFSESGNGG